MLFLAVGRSEMLAGRSLDEDAIETYLNAVDQDTSLGSSLGQDLDGFLPDLSGGINNILEFNRTEDEYSSNKVEHGILNVENSTRIYDTTFDDEYSTLFTIEYLTEDYGTMNASTAPTQILSNAQEELTNVGLPNRPLDILSLTRFADSEGLVSNTGQISVDDLCKGKSYA